MKHLLYEKYMFMVQLWYVIHIYMDGYYAKRN